jgi:hypothetical protein
MVIVNIIVYMLTIFPKKKFLLHDVGELVHLILHFCRRQSCILTASCCNGVGTIGCIMMIHGLLLGRILSWKFRIGYLMLILGIGIFQFGVQKMGFTHALIHGIVLGQNFWRSLGVMLSGFLWLFLGTLLFCGLFSVMPLLLRTGCVGGGLREIPRRFCYGG